MGQVGEDRDVVGDLGDPVEGEPVRRRLDDRRRVACRRHRPEQALELGRLGRRHVLGVRLGDARRSCVSTVPISPAGCPAASSAAAARNEVVVLPSVPVTPTTPSSWLGSPYHQAAARPARPGWPGRRPAGAARQSGSGPLDDRGDGAGCGGGGDVVVAVDVLARHRHEQRARPNARASRAVDPGDRDVGECRPRRSAGHRIGRRGGAPGRGRSAAR